MERVWSGFSVGIKCSQYGEKLTLGKNIFSVYCTAAPISKLIGKNIITNMDFEKNSPAMAKADV